MNKLEREIKEILENLKQEFPIEELVKFSDLDIHEKLQKNPMLIIQYQERLYFEKATLEELERKMEVLKGKRYKHYKFEVEETWEKKEIEDYCLPSDPKINQMKKIIAKQKAIVRFFQMCVRGLEQQGWRMKTMTDRDLKGV